MTRDKAVELARRFRNSIELHFSPSPDTQFVIVVTDASGEFVGVCSNVDPERTEAILYAGAHGAELHVHERKVGT